MPPPEPLGTPAASATPRRRSRRLRGRLEPRQLADYQATISALDTEHGRDVGYTLGSVAATHRRISQALAQGTTPSDESLNVGRDGRGTYLRKNALSWPLLELEAPAPNWTLFDEVTALADRIMVMYRGRVVGIVPGDTSRDVLGLMMAGEWQTNSTKGLN